MFLSMALGYRDVMSQQVEESFQQTGLTHLLVVSGYQVSMVFGLLYSGFMLLGPTRSRTPALRAIFAGAALLVTLLYVLLIGSEMSASRALVAATCLCMESLFESGRRFAQRWGVALVVMQLVWPWAAFEVGVALTFAALDGIGVGACLGRGATASTFLWIQLSVWLFTTTIIAIWNGSVAPMGLVLNILIAPCWSLLNCVVGLTGLVAYPMWHELGSVLLQVVAFMNEAAVDLFLPLEAQAPLGGALTGAAKWAAVLGLMLGCGLLLVQAARERRSYSPVLMAR